MKSLLEYSLHKKRKCMPVPFLFFDLKIDDNHIIKRKFEENPK